MLEVMLDLMMQEAGRRKEEEAEARKAISEVSVARKPSARRPSARDLPADGHGKESLAQIWFDIRTLITAEKESAVCLGQEGSGEEKVRTRIDSYDFHHLELQDSAIKVHLEAKERLVQELCEENQKLKDVGRGLEEELHSNPVARFLKHLAGQHQKARHEAIEDEEGEEDDGPTALKEGDLWLSGHFAGHLTTRAHFLDVTMPLTGVFPVEKVLEALRLVSAEYDKRLREIQPKSSVKSEKSEGAKGVNAWKDLLVVLEAEYDTVKGKSEGPTRDLPYATHSEAERGVAADRAGKEETVALKFSLPQVETALDNAVNKLMGLQRHSLKIRSEADMLHAQNHSLSSVLANAGISGADRARGLGGTLIKPEGERYRALVADLRALASSGAVDPLRKARGLERGAPPLGTVFKPASQIHEALVADMRDLVRLAKELQNEMGKK